MAYGVQLGAKYALIGGPREVGTGRGNEVTNPHGRDNLTGWTGASGGTSTQVIDDLRGAAVKTTRAAIDSATQTIIIPQTGAFGAPAAPGDVWHARASIRPFSATGGLFVDLRLLVQWMDAVGTILSSPTLQTVPASTAGPDVWYDLLGITAAAPANTAFIRILLSVNNDGIATAHEWRARGAMLTKSTVALPYRDGDTPGYYWTGTEHASASAQDGTRAVLNDDTDPDFVGYAVDVTGLEGAEVRENFTDNIEADGAIHGEFYQGRRPVTITAAIGGNVTPTTRNQRQGRWLAASRALRSRGVAHRPTALRWQPDGAPVEMFTILRRQQRPTITGIQMKEASIAMVAADPRIYGLTSNFYEHTPAGAGTAGRTYDRSYDVNYNWAPQRGTFTVTNIGDADTPVILEFVNAMSTFALQNLTTEEEISINGAITNGQTVTVDTGAKTIYLQDGTNLFDRIELPRTRWWGLAPGANVLSFLAETFDATARVRVYHRPAWA